MTYRPLHCQVPDSNLTCFEYSNSQNIYTDQNSLSLHLESIMFVCNIASLLFPCYIM